MGMDIFLIAIGFLILFAVFDLIVGVSNDASNFLNSSIGSKVASRKVIMIVASLGIIVGVTFSSGMMEVARKGIFHPALFTMPELISIFLAVMLTDVFLLDLFNTFGLPTSTTVSIVFELLGAAVAISIVKILSTGSSLASIVEYINTSMALTIIFGILFSVILSFVCGLLVQFLTRLFFTFDYKKRFNRYGAIWCGFALTSINFFIIIKGAKGASFLSAETILWIKNHSLTILLYIFTASTILAQILIMFKVNILKYIILAGTFALALAFAANDLVNFIGVPLAGIFAYKTAIISADPLTMTMGALAKKVPSNTYVLLIAGVIMVLTMWLSKKSRTVSETELSLSRQDEGIENFESIALSRIIVKIVIRFFDLKVFIPKQIRSFVDRRVNPDRFPARVVYSESGSYDLIRASVNLMVASAVVSFATSLKLPLSTTYVTFMVAMGTSFADGSWGRDSAVYRITGVLTVIGGWFFTAFVAFTAAFIFASVIAYFQVYGVVTLILLVFLIVLSNHKIHKKKMESKENDKVFNLKKIYDPRASVNTTFDHLSILLKEISKSLDTTIDALFENDIYRLQKERNQVRTVQNWSNVIIANLFKILRLLQKSDVPISYKYAQSIRRLQKLSDAYRDVVLRSYKHVVNHHKTFMPVQIEELKEVKTIIISLLNDVSEIFAKKDISNYDLITSEYETLWAVADKINEMQIVRIKEGKSKTRLTILYYSIVSDSLTLSKQNLKLLEIFKETFSDLD